MDNEKEILEHVEEMMKLLCSEKDYSPKCTKCERIELCCKICQVKNLILYREMEKQINGEEEIG